MLKGKKAQVRCRWAHLTVDARCVRPMAADLGGKPLEVALKCMSVGFDHGPTWSDDVKTKDPRAPRMKRAKGEDGSHSHPRFLRDLR
jgi:hypothetical protein